MEKLTSYKDLWFDGEHLIGTSGGEEVVMLEIDEDNLSYGVEEIAAWIMGHAEADGLARKEAARGN